MNPYILNADSIKHLDQTSGAASDLDPRCPPTAPSPFPIPLRPGARSLPMPKVLLRRIVQLGDKVDSQHRNSARMRLALAKGDRSAGVAIYKLQVDWMTRASEFAGDFVVSTQAIRNDPLATLLPGPFDVLREKAALLNHTRCALCGHPFQTDPSPPSIGNLESEQYIGGGNG